MILKHLIASATPAQTPVGLTRRHFVSTTVGGAVGLALLPDALYEQAKAFRADGITGQTLIVVREAGS